jgi:hypothetical protein
METVSDKSNMVLFIRSPSATEHVVHGRQDRYVIRLHFHEHKLFKQSYYKSITTVSYAKDGSCCIDVKFDHHPPQQHDLSAQENVAVSTST